MYYISVVWFDRDFWPFLAHQSIHTSVHSFSYQHIKHKRNSFHSIPNAFRSDNNRIYQKLYTIAFRLLWIVNAYFRMLSKQASDECVLPSGFGHFNWHLDCTLMATIIECVWMYMWASLSCVPFNISLRTHMPKISSSSPVHQIINLIGVIWAIAVHKCSSKFLCCDLKSLYLCVYDVCALGKVNYVQMFVHSHSLLWL